MSATKAVFLIVAGCAMEAVAALNQHFYWCKGFYSGDKEAPRWVGRLLFAFIGAVSIIVGLTHLLLGS
jgi:hypothetical protein